MEGLQYIGYIIILLKVFILFLIVISNKHKHTKQQKEHISCWKGGWWYNFNTSSAYTSFSLMLGIILSQQFDVQIRWFFGVTTVVHDSCRDTVASHMSSRTEWIKSRLKSLSVSHISFILDLNRKWNISNFLSD